MDKLESLKITNNMEIDTKMAEEYINKINNMECDWPSSGWLHYEKHTGNIKKEENLSVIFNNYKTNVKDKDLQGVNERLAKKIEENTKMFVQLEYLIRGTDPRDVTEGHVKLMAQLLRCNPAIWNGTGNILYFDRKTHLYNLISVVGDLSRPYTTAILLDDKDLKPLCKFFVDICRDVGIEYIELIYSNQEDRGTLLKENEREIYRESFNLGCTGVVTERADIDSAIDCFIDSSVTAPWRFKYIYVQESIFLEFKETLKARCSTDVLDNVTIGNKSFMIEKHSGPGILTNAYRTVKELLTLIETPYLSVWASETALSHEIALKCTAMTIWINDYGSFFGPPRSCLSVFNLFSNVRTNCSDIKEKLTKWSKITTEGRYELIKAIDNGTHIDELKYNKNSLLEITDNTICFGVPQNLGIIYIENFNKNDVKLLLQLLINGNALCFPAQDSSWRHLQTLGVPISTVDDGNESVMAPMLLEKFKVVRTNYGTIFAN